MLDLKTGKLSDVSYNIVEYLTHRNSGFYPNPNTIVALVLAGSGKCSALPFSQIYSGHISLYICAAFFFAGYNN